VLGCGDRWVHQRLTGGGVNRPTRLTKSNAPKIKKKIIGKDSEKEQREKEDCLLQIVRHE
jgi:hypothetical protein